MSCSEFLSVHVRWRIPADYLPAPTLRNKLIKVEFGYLKNATVCITTNNYRAVILVHTIILVHVSQET